jgi:uroporphyrinogen III methyltransferase/synthase
MASVTRTRPLEGRTIVVTRASAQAQRFVSLLTAAGANVLATPTIAIESPASWAPLDAALDAAETFTWLVFTSVNGVIMVDRRLTTRRRAWSGFARARVAAIGPATAEALVEHGLRVEIVPREYRAEGLVARMRPELAGGDRVLLPRAAQTRDVLVRELTRLGAVVTEVAAYATRRVGASGAALRHALSAGTADLVTFTSSSTARNFAELFTEDERRAWFPALTVASIGPITAATAAEYGLTTRIMPNEYTIPALARAIEAYCSRVPPLPARRGKGGD